jgi:hypothetical protein
MMCLVTVRQLKPGSFDEFREAWAPTPWWPQLAKIEILRNDDNPDQVLTIGYVDVTPDELETLRDSPEILESEAKRLERIAPFEDRIIVNGIFELTEELSSPR